MTKSESELEGLSRQKVALGSFPWGARSDAKMSEIAHRETKLAEQCAALRQVLALPDAELLEAIDYLRAYEAAS
jgi:hypothetical protein